VIGPSFYIHPPTQITYTPVDAQYNSSTSGRLLNPLDSACWTAFRAHQYILPQDVTNLASEYHYSDLGNATTFLAVELCRRFTLPTLCCMLTLHTRPSNTYTTITKLRIASWGLMYTVTSATRRLSSVG